MDPGGVLFLLSPWLGFCQGSMDDADGDFDSGGDGVDGFSALAAGQDRGSFVVVDHGAAPAPAVFPAAGSSGGSSAHCCPGVHLPG
ncbi:hypothetical protein [Nonomuraea turkmeniaca]|uniref:hypothetical protein n=1 Tax=Nonomuraea turkmeniaca TaxID=103838 RepID=UPI00147719A2|nr:hypothetical protein [Nonomuraea turkmeniaca]